MRPIEIEIDKSELKKGVKKLFFLGVVITLSFYGYNFYNDNIVASESTTIKTEVRAVKISKSDVGVIKKEEKKPTKKNNDSNSNQVIGNNPSNNNNNNQTPTENEKKKNEVPEEKEDKNQNAPADNTIPCEAAYKQQEEAIKRGGGASVTPVGGGQCVLKIW